MSERISGTGRGAGARIDANYDEWVTTLSYLIG